MTEILKTETAHTTFRVIQETARKIVVWPIVDGRTRSGYIFRSVDEALTFVGSRF